MKIKAYKNYGVLTHEKTPVYTISNPVESAVVYDRILISIPESFLVSENAAGNILIDTPDGKTYLADEIIGQKNGEPMLAWYDGKNHSVVCNYEMDEAAEYAHTLSSDSKTADRYHSEKECQTVKKSNRNKHIKKRNAPSL